MIPRANSPAMTYSDVYTELATRLELPSEAAMAIPPDRAEALLAYHRREDARRATAQALADRLDVPVAAVFLACTNEGAQQLLDAMDAKKKFDKPAPRVFAGLLTPRAIAHGA